MCRFYHRPTNVIYMHTCFFQYYCNQGTWSRLSQYLTRDTVLSTKVGHETTVLSLCYGRRLIAVILPNAH